MRFIDIIFNILLIVAILAAIGAGWYAVTMGYVERIRKEMRKDHSGEYEQSVSPKEPQKRKKPKKDRKPWKFKKWQRKNKKNPLQQSFESRDGISMTDLYADEVEDGEQLVEEQRRESNQAYDYLARLSESDNSGSNG